MLRLSIHVHTCNICMCSTCRSLKDDRKVYSDHLHKCILFSILCFALDQSRRMAGSHVTDLKISEKRGFYKKKKTNTLAQCIMAG